MVAVDFDGTVVEHSYPEIGKPLPGAVETLQRLAAVGHHLILWTCREGKDLSAALLWLSEHGIMIAGANELPAGLFDPFTYLGESRKVYADVYIDDRNFGGFPGWDAVAAALLGERQEQAVAKALWRLLSEYR